MTTRSSTSNSYETIRKYSVGGYCYCVRREAPSASTACWESGRIDKRKRRTGNILKRPVNRLFPFVQRDKPTSTLEKTIPNGGDELQSNDTDDMSANEVEENENREITPNAEVLRTTNVHKDRVRREAAVVGELRRKLGDY